MPTRESWVLIESSDQRSKGFIRRATEVGVPGRMAIGRTCVGGNISASAARANGRKMAAAPDMEAALEGLVAFLRAYQHPCESDIEEWIQAGEAALRIVKEGR